MAINRYDTPAQAEFMNTYVPIPFDQMMKVGMMKQQMVEQGDKMADDTLASLATFQVAPFDEENYLDIRKGYEQKINDLYTSSGSSGDYGFKRGMAKLRTEMAMDPTLRGMQYNLGQYQGATKSLEEAKNKGTTAYNRYELEKSIKDITEKGGTVGLMEETGSSKWTPGSWYENVDVDKAIEEYINDVSESSSQFDSFLTDDKGKFIIDKSQAGKSLNALAAPFGLTYKQEKDSITGKMGYKLVDAGGGSRIMIDFFQSSAGEDLLRAAKREADRTDGDVMQIASEKYFSIIGSKINERVNTKGTYNISYDPKWLADYNRAQDNKQFQLTTGMLMGIPKSTLTSQKEIVKAEIGLDNALLDVNERESEYKNRRDVIELMNNPGRDPYMLDDEGKDVTIVLKQYQSERDQIQRDKQDLDDKMFRVKQEAGVKSGWEVEAELQEKYKDQKWDSMQQGNIKLDILQHLKEQAKVHANSLYGTGASIEAHERAYNDKYEELLMKESGNYEKINEILKRDSQASSELIGVTSLPTKDLDEYLANKFIAWAAPGGETEKGVGGGAIRLQNMRTGEDFTADDYKNIGDKKAIVAGVTYGSRDRSMKVVYRTFNKKGILNEDAVVADAPQGLTNWLVNNGYTSEVTIALNEQVPSIENSRSKTGIIGINGIDIEVHKLTATEKLNASAGVNYYITPKGTSFKTTETGPDGKPVTSTQSVPTTYTASSIGEILNWYIQDIFIPNSRETIPTK